MGRRVHDGVDHRGETRGHEDGAGDVEFGRGVSIAHLLEVERRGHARHDAEGHVDEEDPAPRDEARENAAEQRAHGTARARDRAPRTDGLGKTGSMERRHDDGERRRRQDGSADALNRANRDHLGAVVRQARADAREGEDSHAHQIDVSATEVVGRATTEQQEARESEDVRVDDPLRARVGEVQVVTHARQRDVDDGDVQDHHELRDARDGQDEPIGSVPQRRFGYERLLRHHESVWGPCDLASPTVNDSADGIGHTGCMVAQYIFTMRDLRRFYPPDREVLRGINLSFYPGAKIGVIGANGSGKTSLLRIMAGLDDGFTGEARLTPGFSVGYLPQEPQLDPTKDVVGNVADGVAEQRDLFIRFNEVCAAMGDPDADFDALLAEQADLQTKIDAANAWDLERTLEIAMDALRVPPPDADVTTLSGGERRRVALCRLLLSKPDLLLLDEPTNHLDAESVAWLERILQEYSGTVVAITHDRYFLDNAAQWILELDRGTRHSVGRQLLLVVRAEAGAPGRRREGRQRSPRVTSARARVDSPVAARSPEQGQGARHLVQPIGRRVRVGRSARRQAGDRDSAGSALRRRRRQRRGAHQGI